MTDSPLSPPVPIEEIISPPLLLWWQWALLIIAINIGLFLIWLATKFYKKRKPATSSISPLDYAKNKLEKISSKALSPRELSMEFSIILREYILKRFNCPTLFQTNEEINAHHLKKLSISDKQQDEAIDFINQLESLKYANQSADNISQKNITSSLKNLIIELDKEWLNSQQPADNQPPQA